ncbi:hypothetical protein N7G274_004776 [Stereocaulon virgatum]|uniref:Uncharacterized protein n=1 Tax=Stereocaulon virgatum TaxID=373712 RepID=A0ABR4AB48_9LECA
MSHDDTHRARYDPDDFKAFWNDTANEILVASELQSLLFLDEERESSADIVFHNKSHAYAYVYWPYHLLQSRDCRMSPQFKDISILRYDKHHGLEEIVELLIQYGAENSKGHPDFVHSAEEQLKEVGSDDTDWETGGSDVS